MKNKNFVRSTVEIALFSALIACSSFLSIPIFTLPVTLQTLAIFLSLLLLGAWRGTVSVLIYVALGIVGVPVFSGFTGGIGRILDIEGGFVFGFCLLALTYWGIVSLFGKSTVVKIIAAVFGQLVLYASGIVWYVAAFDGDFLYGVGALILPYIFFDAVKMFIAFYVTKKIKKLIK